MDQSLQLHKGIIKTTKNVVHIISKRASWMQARYLWIDAICIDQSNTPEKQSQIRKMRDIYTFTKRTIAWISYEPIPFYDMWLLSLSNEISRSSIRNTLVHLIAGSNDSVVHDVQHIIEKKKKFLSQKYWSRGWIVQEFALAHEVHIMYGGHFLSVDDLRSYLLPQPLVTSIELAGPMFEECKDGTEFKHYVDKDGVPINVVKEPQSTIWTLLFARELISVKKYASLSTVLSISTHFDTFSPHDKVYSVLGLLEAEWYKLQPDYTIPIDDLYFEVAQILSDKSWDSVLQFAGLGFARKISTLPSWVPDWTSVSLSSHTIQKLDLHISQVLDEATGSTEPYYSYGFPTHQPSLKPEIQIRSRELIILGFPLARIKALSGPIKKQVDTKEQGESRFSDIVQDCINGDFFTRMEAVAKSLPDQYELTQEPIQEALRRTLVGNIWKSPPFVDLDSSWSTVYNLPWTADYPAPPTIVDTYKDTKEQWSNGIYAHNKVGELIGKMYQLITNFYGVLAGKQLARSGKGHLCLVPELARENDLLILVKGLHQPLMLRQAVAPGCDDEMKEESWQLVGSCYVHGLMDGTFVPNSEDEVKRSFTII